LRRTAEDYAVVYLGASIFKVTRLLLVALSSVHFFSCVFYKVLDLLAFLNPTQPKNSKQEAALSMDLK
jgi:hypothetical protein